jgi:hypothetical protein
MVLASKTPQKRTVGAAASAYDDHFPRTAGHVRRNYVFVVYTRTSSGSARAHESGTLGHCSKIPFPHSRNTDDGVERLQLLSTNASFMSCWSPSLSVREKNAAPEPCE